MASSLSTSTLPSVVLLLERTENGFARGEGGGVRSGGEEDMRLLGDGTMGHLSKSKIISQQSSLTSLREAQ